MAYTDGNFMEMSSLSTLIRNETEVGANTAARVGDAFLSVVDMFDGVMIIKVNEDGFFIVDKDMNIGLQYDTQGINVAAITQHFKNLVGSGGGGGGTALNSLLEALNAQNPQPSDGTYLKYEGGKFAWSEVEGGGGDSGITFTDLETI